MAAKRKQHKEPVIQGVACVIRGNSYRSFGSPGGGLFVSKILNMNLKNKQTKILLITASLFMLYLVYLQGMYDGKTEYISKLEDKMTITECTGGGCFVEIPESYSIYASCQEDYLCTKNPLTEEGKKLQEIEQKEWDEFIKNVPRQTQ